MKILMVEDNQTLCEMMAMFFKKEKWEAGYAQDGVKAVEMFKKDPTGWDIVLLDLNLPKMDGMQVAADGKLSLECPAHRLGSHAVQPRGGAQNSAAHSTCNLACLCSPDRPSPLIPASPRSPSSFHRATIMICSGGSPIRCAA